MALPNGYTQVEYIESSGTQYIDTGFMPNGNTRVVCDFQFTRQFSTSSAVFGARTSGTTAQLYALIHLSSNTFRTDYYGNVESIVVTNELARMIVDKNKNVTTLDGKTLTYTAVTTNTSCNMFLFAVNQTGSVKYPACVKIFSCKIYDNGTLIRDYIPCVNEHKVAGLYDTVNDVFYTDATGGTFTAGMVTSLPNGYTRVDYIESTGTQYIDTGFKPNQNTRVVAEMEYVSHTDATIGLFGTHSSNALFETHFFNEKYYFQYGSVGYNVSAAAPVGQKIYIDLSKNSATCNINGTVLDVTPSASATFTSSYTLVIHALNRSGKIQYHSNSRTYSFKVYDNGTLVRDYIPCKNASGVAGLFDLVNGVFYTDAAGSAFIAGAELTSSYKIVDAAKLDGAMKATADAIRAKAGGADKIAWKETNGFADAVNAITTVIEGSPVQEGSFTPEEDVTEMTISHNLGVTPRIAVYFPADGFDSLTYSVAGFGFYKKYDLEVGWEHTGGGGLGEGNAGVVDSSSSTSITFCSPRSGRPFAAGVEYSYILVG